MNKKVFNCYLIGDDYLLLECAEILLSNHFVILGIVSSLQAVEEFCSQKKITYFKNFNTAKSLFDTISFDYLFSIVNGAILPLPLLKKARCMAINYHNGPLPRYGGVHATSWAILNEEKKHGVTWHEMNAIVDGGNILKQGIIEVEDKETALSLGVKCYQEAIKLFKELAKELLEGNFKSSPQNLAQRTFYTYAQKPKYGGWLNWEETSKSIDKMFRALSLGNYYPNRLGAPKFKIAEDFFIISKMRVVSHLTSQLPGTLLKISLNSWVISTSFGQVILEMLCFPTGEKISNLIDLAKKYNLKEGDQLPLEKEKILNLYQKTCEKYDAHETFWVRKKKYFTSAYLPFQNINAFSKIKNPLKLICKFNAKKILNPQSENNITNILLTSFLIYLYKMGNKERLGVGLSYPLLHQLPLNFASLFSRVIPFALVFEDDFNAEKTLKYVSEQRQHLEQHLSFAEDIIYRYPDLIENNNKNPLIVVVLGNSRQIKEQIEVIHAPIVFSISDVGEMGWYCNETNSSVVEIIQNSARQIPIITTDIISVNTKIISKISMTSPQEKKQLLKWGDSPIPHQKNKSVVQVFAQVAREMPSNIAVSYKQQSLTYEEVNKQSNQLARLLKKNGLQPGEFVGICTSREIHLVVGLLAILKVGAAYIPIDWNYPEHHIEFILNDSKPALTITSKAEQNKISLCCNQQNIPLLVFENIIKDSAREDTHNLNYAHIQPENLAYIIYTSGTTGKPKGVMIPHRGIVRLVKSTNYIKILPNDRVAQAASISFDAATFEIWGALLNGAALLNIPQLILLNKKQFSHFLIKNKISVLWLTSSLFNQYASYNCSIFRNLTYLLVGGDVLNPEQIMKVVTCKKGSPQFVLNGYGPTENTTFTTTYPIVNKNNNHETIPIGKPITNTKVYILDDDLQPCPVGAPGELYIGGDGLALGYLNRPETNKIKFIPNLYDINSKTLLYKTGDIVRWMPDGNIDFLSRQDNQVKIRGFRIEMEGIKNVLLRHPLVEQCVIMIRKNKKNQKLIVAYIVLKKETKMMLIKQYMHTQIPYYMVPNIFIAIDKIPLTLNGKINFDKLPPPDFMLNLLELEYVPPQTQTEKNIEKIWCELFGLKEVGIYNTFFELGGHSLMLTQLVLMIKKELNFDLSLQYFLETPTIHHLAKIIDVKVNQELNSTPFFHRWQTDCQLDNSIITPNNLPLCQTINAVLLTGANGFLGAHLLYEIYHSTTATIYCVIRAKSIKDAQKKLGIALNRYHLDVEISDRIKVFLGDLEKPLLGLSPKKFNELAETIDVIYHNGAKVHHLYNYEALRATNVLSVREIIKLACTKKNKFIHYISSLSAAGGYLDHQNKIIEDFIYQNLSVPPSDGYSQTKWMAELLLTNAYMQGCNIKIYRPAWILGHSTGGRIDPSKNHLLMLIKGCIQLKYAPDWDMELDIIPVDYLSKMIIKISLNKEINSNLFNMINSHKLSWRQLINYLNERGYSISLIPAIEWREAYLKTANQENALYSLLLLYLNKTDWMKGLDKITTANNDNMRGALELIQMNYPPINKVLLNTYFSFLEVEGFFPQHETVQYQEF